MFQSPSLRGSGRFTLVAALRKAIPSMFQSPSLRGSGRFRRGGDPPAEMQLSFNPLHCGAVVASIRALGVYQLLVVFQSPSLRGSGRFLPLGVFIGASTMVFQSPSLRGSGRF